MMDYQNTKRNEYKKVCTQKRNEYRKRCFSKTNEYQKCCRMKEGDITKPHSAATLRGQTEITQYTR